MRLQYCLLFKYINNKFIRNNIKIMESTLLLPPKFVRGMIDLDRNKFNKTIKIPKLDLGNANAASILPYIKKYLLKMENLKPIQSSGVEASSSDTTSPKHVLLNPLLVKSWTDIEFSSRENLVALGISDKSFRIEELVLKYDNWRPDEILRSVLPTDKEGLSSFSKIGHIVHVNLKEHLLPYKKLIGEVLLDKVKGCKTVVNKLESIDTTYRFFKMEVLCGEDNMQCQVKENHCRFEFDFSTVYWNPRLCTEHERIANLLSEGDILYDVFSGVGPFAIPCAKKKVTVLANDLNPDSFKWLNHNLKLNKINPEFLKTFNKDGRDFILSDFKSDFLNRCKNALIKANTKVHITMNLPATAIEFIGAFCNLFTADELNMENIACPTVHVYCFVKADAPLKNARELAESNLGCALQEGTFDIFHVRNVSPKKEMMRISFQLNSSILCGKTSDCLKRKCDAETSSETKKSIVMAKQKKKGAKKNNVFKVAGAKSLKVKTKAKAKAVKTNLKKIDVKKKVKEIDQKLEEVQETVRQTPKKTAAKKGPTVSAAKNTKKKVQKSTKQTLRKLNSLKV